MRGQLKVTLNFSTAVGILWARLSVDPEVASVACFRMFIKVLLGAVSLFLCWISVEHRPEHWLRANHLSPWWRGHCALYGEEV